MVTTLIVFDVRLGVICGLPLLVLYSATRDFSTRTPVLPSPQKPTHDLNKLRLWLISVDSVPNQCPSARTTRLLDKVRFLLPFVIVSIEFPRPFQIRSVKANLKGLVS